MTEQRVALDDSEFIDALLNLVIPPSFDGNLPGAGTLGLAPAVAAALRADKLLGPLVEVGAEAVLPLPPSAEETRARPPAVPPNELHNHGSRGSDHVREQGSRSAVEGSRPYAGGLAPKAPKRIPDTFRSAPVTRALQDLTATRSSVFEERSRWSVRKARFNCDSAAPVRGFSCQELVPGGGVEGFAAARHSPSLFDHGGSRRQAVTAL